MTKSSVRKAAKPPRRNRWDRAHDPCGPTTDEDTTAPKLADPWRADAVAGPPAAIVKDGWLVIADAYTGTLKMSATRCDAAGGQQYEQSDAADDDMPRKEEGVHQWSSSL